MSGSNKEHPTAADETVDQRAEERNADEAAPEPSAGTGVAMTAAEALAMATEAAATDGTEPAGSVTDADEAAPAPEGSAEATAAKPDAETAAPAEEAQEAAAPADEESATEPEAAAEPEAIAEPEATAEPETATEAESVAEPTQAEHPAEAKPDAEKPADAAPAPPPPDRPELRAVREAMSARTPIEGRVIGWNNGGFHLAPGDLSAFCPRSEMEIGDVQEPESYLDKTFLFRVLRLQGKGRRIVVSRAAQLRNEKSRQRNELRKQLKAGVELEGTVASLTDFGAFVDLGGAQGLVHVSEISHRRVEHPRDVLSEGQEVRVKVLKVEQGGRRISLSIRALEPNPWKDLADRFPRGAVVRGTVEKANQIGAFIELAPGLTGLLPARSMNIPRETNPARAYPPGKEVSVQIVSVDPRRQRIALALEGSGLEGSRTDYQEYQRKHREGADGDGFNALASAFKRLQDD